MRLRRVILALALGALAQAAPLSYQLDIAIDSSGSLTGQAVVRGVAPAAWPEVVFRLYPNALKQDTLQVLAVNGKSGSWDQVHPTAFAVPVSLEASQTFSIPIAFQGQVPPLSETGGYGIFARSSRAMVLAQAYPLLAPWSEDSWLVEPALPWGDSVVADVADYAARVSLPPGWALVACGEETEVEAGGYLVAGENLRELALVALRGYSEQVEPAGTIPATGYFLPEHEEAGAAGLKVAIQSLELYSDLLGPYPFSELDVVEVPLQGAAGVEYPGLILVGQEYLSRYPSDPLFFPMIFAHEVAHQWWYAQVGNDQVAEPWLDEALATYTSGLYFQSQGRFDEILSYWEDSYLRGRARNPLARVSSPLWEFPDGAGYGGIVYSGGALFFHSVRERMGDDAFFRALRRYLGEYRWKIARGEDLIAILKGESPRPLDDLLREWLDVSVPELASP